MYRQKQYFADKNPSENDELKAIREQKEQPLLDAFQGANVVSRSIFLKPQSTSKPMHGEHVSHSVASLIRRLRSRDDGTRSTGSDIGCSMVGRSLYSECPYPEWFENDGLMLKWTFKGKTFGSWLGPSTAILKHLKSEVRCCASTVG